MPLSNSDLPVAWITGPATDPSLVSNPMCQFKKEEYSSKTFPDTTLRDFMKIFDQKNVDAKKKFVAIMAPRPIWSMPAKRGAWPASLGGDRERTNST
jgi:hypothetical protein